MGNKLNHTDEMAPPVESEQELTSTLADESSTTPKLSIKDIETKEKSRRIVKATHPKKSQSEEKLAVVTAEEDEDGFQKVSYEKQKPSFIGESPSVAREMEQEKAAGQLKERVKTAADRQRSSRDKEQRDRRLASPEAKKNKIPTETTLVQPKANPMSRFLSVFSVSSHPEHKRAYKGDTADEDYAKKPDETRLRQSDDEIKETTKVEKDDSFWKQPPAVVVASAVAVAAIVVGLLLRWKPR